MKRHNIEKAKSHWLQVSYFSLLRLCCCFWCSYCRYSSMLLEHLFNVRPSVNDFAFLSHLITTQWGIIPFYWWGKLRTDGVQQAIPLQLIYKTSDVLFYFFFRTSFYHTWIDRHVKFYLMWLNYNSNFEIIELEKKRLLRKGHGTRKLFSIS